MIILEFTNGQQIKTRCKTPATAIAKALQVSPVHGSIAGTRMLQGGKLIGTITEGCSWLAA